MITILIFNIILLGCTTGQSNENQGILHAINVSIFVANIYHMFGG